MQCENRNYIVNEILLTAFSFFVLLTSGRVPSRQSATGTTCDWSLALSHISSSSRCNPCAAQLWAFVAFLLLLYAIDQWMTSVISITLIIPLYNFTIYRVVFGAVISRLRKSTRFLHGFVFAISKLGSAAKEKTEDWKWKRL
jgi:hypothetical protein